MRPLRAPGEKSYCSPSPCTSITSSLLGRKPFPSLPGRLRNPAPACGGNGRGEGGWRNEHCERQRSRATIEQVGTVSPQRRKEVFLPKAYVSWLLQVQWEKDKKNAPFLFGPRSRPDGRGGSGPISRGDDQRCRPPRRPPCWAVPKLSHTPSLLAST